MADEKQKNKPGDYSNFMAYLKLEPYLAQWVAHEHGFPIRFPRGSIENDIIELGLKIRDPEKEPVDLPGEGKYPVVLPFFKFKDVMTYNHLSDSSKDELVHCLKVRFAIALWNDLFKFGHIGKQKQDLIYAWMDAHDIDDTETNWNAISKIYARKRKSYNQQKRRRDDSY